MSIDLRAAIEAESETNTEATTTEEPEESEIPHRPNEVTDGYALMSDVSAFVEDVSMELMGNDPVWGLIEWEDGIEDYAEIVTEDLSPMQKLDLIYKLLKSTFGEMQSELNEGYGMGWDTSGEGPPSVYDNEEVEHVPYLDVHSDLEAFASTTLDPGEVEQFEAEGFDMDDYGFDDSIEGPQLPVLQGERVPVVVKDNDEVVDLLKAINQIDFDELTHYPEGGPLQGTPTLNPEGSNGDKGEGSTNEVDTDEVSLASNPEAVKSFNVNDIRSRVTDIDSLRTINTMIRAEEESDNPRSSALDRLEERRSAIQSDEADTENGNEASQDEVEESVENVEGNQLSEVQMSLANTMLENGEVSSYKEAKEELLG